MFATSGTEEIWLAYVRDTAGVALGPLGVYGSLTGAGVIGGAILGARVYRIAGRLRSNAFAAMTITVATIAIVMYVTNALTASVAAILFGLAMGIVHVTVFSLAMSLREPGSEASTFAVFSTFMALGTTVAIYVIPLVAGAAGYATALLLSAAAALLILPLLALYTGWQRREPALSTVSR